MSWSEGQALKECSKPEVTRAMLANYAEVSGDNNPIHLDDVAAKAQGLPGVIAHGMLSMAFMADAVCFNFPEAGHRLLRLKTRFKKLAFPGDRLTVGGSVKKMSAPKRCLLSLWIKNQHGEITADGEAEIEATR